MIIPAIPAIPDIKDIGLVRRSTHPGAAAYRASLISAGANPSRAQVAALSLFFQEGDKSGWKTKVLCLFLPVWGTAGPNAINAMGGSPGTWNGTVSHAGKQARSAGANGYFDTGCNPVGYLTARVGLFAVAPVIDTAAVLIGVRNGTDLLLDNYTGRAGWAAGDAIGPNTGYSGMNVRMGYGDGTLTKVARLAPGGGTLTIENSYTPTGAIPAGNIFAMAFNAGGPSLYNSQPFYAWGVIVTIWTDAQAQSFAIALDQLITSLRA